MKRRLQTFLAACGVSSRRGADTVIADGRVSVNGKIVLEKGFRIDTDTDIVAVDGKRLVLEEKAYYIVNKPKGYISTVRDPHATRTVVDLVPGKDARLFPVGRLDKDTTGLLLLTNDGDLANQLMHPRFEIIKKYRAKVLERLSAREISELESGISLDEARTAPCRVSVISSNERWTLLDIEIHEGKKRQIRRMFKAIGHPVIELARIEFAGLTLGTLKTGEFRRLSQAEVEQLKR